MTEVDLLTKVATTLAGPVGAFLAIAIVSFALATKRLVPGYVHEQCEKDRDRLRGDIDARVAKNEADLEQLRRERMGQRHD